MLARSIVSLALAVTVSAIVSSVAGARVFYAREEVQDLAFPGATRMEAMEFFLTGDQRAEIERESRAAVESDLITAYAGYAGDTLLGYAFIDTHQVRTLPETFLVVVDADGKVLNTYVLAFYEPLEYLPADRWLSQYQGAQLTNDLRVGSRIAGITGSTLTAEAINGGIRRALAIHSVLIARQAESGKRVAMGAGDGQ